MLGNFQLTRIRLLSYILIFQSRAMQLYAVFTSISLSITSPRSSECTGVTNRSKYTPARYKTKRCNLINASQQASSPSDAFSLKTNKNKAAFLAPSPLTLLTYRKAKEAGRKGRTVPPTTIRMNNIFFCVLEPKSLV